jgi:hypothetical protein
MSKSSSLLGILVEEIIIDDIFSWLSLLWLLYNVTGGIHNTDKRSLSDNSIR